MCSGSTRTSDRRQPAPDGVKRPDALPMLATEANAHPSFTAYGPLPLCPIGRAGRATASFVALFAHLSPESRWRRFLGPKGELTPRELATSPTSIISVTRPSLRSICATARSSASAATPRYGDRPGTASIAVAVADELQRSRIAMAAFARRTLERARVNGFMLLTATTLWENQPARALLRRLGLWRSRASHDGVIDRELA